ncbi:MAG: four helix bundle protein [Saprospiraceae bacterium]
MAEECSRKSIAERKRYFEISRGSIIEVDTELDIALALDYTVFEDMEQTGKLIIRCFKMLSAMIND